MKQGFFNIPISGQGKGVKQLLKNEIIKLRNDKVYMSYFQNFPRNDNTIDFMNL